MAIINVARTGPFSPTVVFTGSVDYDVQTGSQVRVSPVDGKYQVKEEVAVWPGAHWKSPVIEIGVLDSSGRLRWKKFRVAPRGPGSIQTRASHAFVNNRFAEWDVATHWSPYPKHWTRDGIYRLCPVGPWASRLISGVPETQVGFFGGCPIPKGLTQEEKRKYFLNPMEEIEERAKSWIASVYETKIRKKIWKKIRDGFKRDSAIGMYYLIGFAMSDPSWTDGDGGVRFGSHYIDKATLRNQVEFYRKNPQELSGLRRNYRKARRKSSTLGRVYQEIKRWDRKVITPFMEFNLAAGATIMGIAVIAASYGALTGALLAAGITGTVTAASSLTTASFLASTIVSTAVIQGIDMGLTIAQKELVERELMRIERETAIVERWIGNEWEEISERLDTMEENVRLLEFPRMMREMALKAATRGLNRFAVEGMVYLANEIEGFILSTGSFPSQEWMEIKGSEVMEEIKKTLKQNEKETVSMTKEELGRPDGKWTRKEIPTSEKKTPPPLVQKKLNANETGSRTHTLLLIALLGATWLSR